MKQLIAGLVICLFVQTPCYSQKDIRVKFFHDDVTIILKPGTAELGKQDVTAYEFSYVEGGYRYSYRYVPASKKHNGLFQTKNDGGFEEIFSWEYGSPFGVFPTGDTLVIANSNDFYLFYDHYLISGQEIVEVGEGITQPFGVANFYGEPEPMLLASIIAAKLSSLSARLERDNTRNSNESLGDYLKTTANEQKSSYQDGLSILSTEISEFEKTATDDERDIFYGRGYDNNGFTRAKLDVDQLIDNYIRIIEIYELTENPDFFISYFSFWDLHLFIEYVDLITAVHRDAPIYVSRRAEINQKRKRVKWRDENHFKHDVLITYELKEWECSLCKRNCSSHGNPNFTLNTVTDLEGSEYYQELLQGLKNRTNLALNLKYRGCSHSICSESLTGETPHQWKQTRSETISEIVILEN